MTDVDVGAIADLTNSDVADQLRQRGDYLSIVAASRIRGLQERIGEIMDREHEAARIAADTIASQSEDLDLLRARAPRAYILTRATEWQRMFREAIGFLHTCRRQHHGTDLSGRHHLIDALEAAMKELGEPENERRARAIAELNADEGAARAAASGLNDDGGKL